MYQPSFIDGVLHRCYLLLSPREPLVDGARRSLGAWRRSSAGRERGLGRVSGDSVDPSSMRQTKKGAQSLSHATPRTGINRH